MDIAEYYENYWREKGDSASLPRLRFLAQYVDTDLKTLEINAGAGLLAKMLSDKGVEIEATELSHEGTRLINEKGVPARQVDLDCEPLPYDDETFDWLWCADVLWPGPKEHGFPVQDPLPIVHEFARVVRPGGIVALVYWSSQKLLPGYPLLEARLDTTSMPTAPFSGGCSSSDGMPPERHCLRALGWLRAAGLRDCTARTFVAQVQAPLADAVHPRDELQDALAAAMDMFWGQAQPEVSAEDWAQFQRLCQPGSPEYLLDVPEYYGFLTYTLFWGRVGG